VFARITLYHNDAVIWGHTLAKVIKLHYCNDDSFETLIFKHIVVRVTSDSSTATAAMDRIVATTTLVTTYAFVILSFVLLTPSCVVWQKNSF
jgi:hypothetical protein